MSSRPLIALLALALLGVARAETSQAPLSPQFGWHIAATITSGMAIVLVIVGVVYILCKDRLSADCCGGEPDLYEVELDNVEQTHPVVLERQPLRSRPGTTRLQV